MAISELFQSFTKEANFKIHKWATISFELKKFLEGFRIETFRFFGRFSDEIGILVPTILYLILRLFAVQHINCMLPNIIFCVWQPYFFDSLGLRSPITLQPKLIFQELRRNKLEWDKIANDRNFVNKWTKFLHEFCILLDMVFVVRDEMSNYMGLTTVQGRHKT